MKAIHKIREMKYRKFEPRGLSLDLDDVATLRRCEMTLRRCEMTLHRWCELECGTDAGHIERDEKTGKPRFFNARARYLTANDPRAWSIVPDRETGALKRVRVICERYGIDWYYQTDPRGCALYIAPRDAGMNNMNYSTVGVAVCD